MERQLLQFATICAGPLGSKSSMEFFFGGGGVFLLGGGINSFVGGK